MNLFLIPDSDLALGSPLIKACDREVFSDALDLLATAKAQTRALEARVVAQTQQGYDAGMAQGLADAEAMLAQEIASFAEATARYRRDLEARVAEAAFAATVAVIGTIDDVQVVSAIVREQLAKRDADEALTITVAPSAIEQVSPGLSGSPNITLIADPAMASTDCRITATEGRIVANLSLQLDMLRQRWGLTADQGGAA